MRTVSVVIVNWNTGKLLARCLSTLCTVPDASLIQQVVVVDNASTDRSIALAREHLQRIKCHLTVSFIPQTNNLGFARATNVGIAAVGDGEILLLNPDTEVLPGALSAMLSALEKSPKVAVVGPMLLNPDRSVQPSVRSFPTLGVFIWLFLKLHRLAPHISWWRRYMLPDFNYEKEQVVDQVMGAAFLIRAEARKELGALDDHFWLWFEEVDFCKRAYAAGWKVMYLPSAQILHHGATSFNQLIGFRRVVPFLLSALQYARLHLRIWQWGVLAVLLPFALFLSFPAALVHIRGKQKNRVRL